MTGADERLAAALADRYRLDRELGQGGMATVYLADDVRHRRKVAIKVLRPELAEALGAERFLREIETTANLRHPHILPLYDSGEADGFLFYVMPLVEGESLRDRLDREKQLPLDDALLIAREVADALSYAHGRGVIHRDIKPENVLLEHGHAVVADFGIARAISSAGGEGLTMTGMAVGTPRYMSPEQAAGERDVDGRSDLYSLACMTYEMLAGQPPFTGPTVESVVHQHIAAEPRAITQIRPAVPAAIAGALQRALAKNPADRYNPVAQFSEALRPGAAAPSAAPAPAPMDRSIVILPFVNLSADPENEYFSDGLTEELIADLARVKALRVISRTSSMQLKGTTKGIRAIGAELGVRYVLEGSVRKAGNALRITAQLIDAGTDAHLWSEKYGGTMDDVFDLQERVSRAIVEALDVTLSRDEDAQLTDRPIRNVRAFEFFLRARQELRRFQLERGVALLEQAVAIEGDVPALRALRGYACITRLRMGIDREQALREAESEARALIGVAPGAPYGHALLGFALYERGDHPAAVRSARAALALDPNDAEVLFFLGVTLVASGQNREVAATSARLLACDPLSPFADMLAGIARWFVGGAADGTASMERALTLDPESAICQWSLGYNYALLGRFAEADARAQWLVQHVPQLPYTIQLRALVAAAQGRKDEALEWLRQVDTTSLDAHHTFHLCESFALAGDTARALTLFARAVDDGFYPHEFFAMHCPFLAPLRGSAEFERILAKAARRVAEFDA